MGTLKTTYNYNLSLHKLRASLPSPVLLRKICCLAQIRSLTLAISDRPWHVETPLAVAEAAAFFPSLIIIIILQISNYRIIIITTSRDGYWRVIELNHLT